MKAFLSSLVLLGILAALVYRFQKPDSESEGSQGDGSTFSGTTRTGGNAGGSKNHRVGRPLIPGAEDLFFGGGDPEANSVALWEFVDELDLSEVEAEQFFEILRTSNQRLSAAIDFDGGAGEPEPPMPEELMGAVLAKEQALGEVLGDEGARRYKAFSTTLLARKVINHLVDGVDGIGLTPEQKARVLYGAYEQLETRGAAASPTPPHQFASSLNDAVLERSAEYLSDEDQARLAEALEKDSQMRLPPEFEVTLPDLPTEEGLIPPTAP